MIGRVIKSRKNGATLNACSTSLQKFLVLVPVLETLLLTAAVIPVSLLILMSAAQAASSSSNQFPIATTSYRSTVLLQTPPSSTGITLAKLSQKEQWHPRVSTM